MNRREQNNGLREPLLADHDEQPESNFPVATIVIERQVAPLGQESPLMQDQVERQQEVGRFNDRGSEQILDAIRSDSLNQNEQAHSVVLEPGLEAGEPLEALPLPHNDVMVGGRPEVTTTWLLKTFIALLLSLACSLWLAV